METATPPIVSRISPIETVFHLGRFVPASVQRDYQWRTTNCLTLLYDIDRVFTASSFTPEAIPADDTAVERDEDAVDLALTAGVPTPTAPKPLDAYMLGAIVLTEAEQGLFCIYDGLQRLTTLTILVAVLRDLTRDQSLFDRLDSLIRAKLPQSPMRVTLMGRDTTLLTQIQPRGEAIKARRTPPSTDMGKRIRIAAQAFREKLKPWPTNRRDAFARFLLERVHIDVQQAADARLARQIFVTTNTRGRSLDRIELFKGQLTDIATDDASASRIVGQWNMLRALLGDRLDDFLVSVDFLERQAPQGSDCLSALADHVARTRGPVGVEAFVQRLIDLAHDYNALIEVLATPSRDALTANIWRLQLFRWQQWRPLALLWFGDYRRATQTTGAGSQRRIAAASRRFDELHRRCMGIVLAGFSSSDRETIFARAVGQAKAKGNPLSSSGALAFKPMQIARVQEGLRLPITDQDVRSTLMRWTESVLHGDVPPAYVKEATVEHILPRRPAQDSPWLDDFPDVEERYLACHALGNLAALDRPRNEKLKNATFQQKLPVFAEAVSDYRSLADVPQTGRWTRDAIEARTAHLAAIIEDTLRLPVSDIAAVAAK